MIVELSSRDYVRLGLGEDVQVGGVAVRLSMSLTESAANGAESLPHAGGDVESLKRDPLWPPSNAVVFTMHAKYPGRCRKCASAIVRGLPIVMDTREKGALCIACGTPVLDAFNRESATAV